MRDTQTPTSLDEPSGPSANVDVELGRLFDELVVASGCDLDELYDGILREFAPDDVLSVALSEHASKGNERRLVLAASLLADYGSASLPALRRLCVDEAEECEHFVSTIAHLNGTTSEERASLLSRLARHADEDVRLAVLDSADALEPEHSAELLGILAEDEDPAIAEEARERLDELRRNAPHERRLAVGNHESHECHESWD